MTPHSHSGGIDDPLQILAAVSISQPAMRLRGMGNGDWMRR